MKVGLSWVAVLVSLFLCPLTSTTRADEPLKSDLSAENVEFFEKQVRPLLVKRCFSCHGGTKAGGGLSLSSAAGWKKGGESGPALQPGKPDQSLLIEAINYRSLEMPPPDKGGKLPDEEIAVLTKWVEIGAPDPRDGHDSIGGMDRETAKTWWAFQALPSPDAPLQPQRIDELLRHSMQSHGLKPQPPADKRTLIRRVTYDLTGLPPSADEVAAFQADNSPQAYDRLIERLLDSPQYGVHWGRHWLDVVRYADTAGENTDRPLPHAWRYRNWVFEAFQRDLPFDQFIRLQLAGDILTAQESGSQRIDGIVATGYLAIARRFGHEIDKDMHLTHEDVIDNLGKNFLGLTLGCARCHDHKYDPVSSDDYYALYGIFESTRFPFPGCEAKGQPRDMVPLIDISEADALTASFQRQMSEYDQFQQQKSQRMSQEARELKELAAQSLQLLTTGSVGEGAAVSIHESHEDLLDRIVLKKGEALQLTVLPNANHGADTTRVQLEITRQDVEPKQSWNPESIIDRFTSGGPAIEHNGATWCLMDVTDGPIYLHEQKLKINNMPELMGWSIGDTPSSFVNTSAEPVSVWTKLSPRSFFVHPGPNRNVAVAWICPEDGVYQLRGSVTDAHPAGLDGVSYRLERIASSDFGARLVGLAATLTQKPPPRPAPPAFPVAYAVLEREAKNARIQQRGDPEKLGAEVPRHWLSVFGGETVPAKEGSGRRELGDWIAAHPLAARVMMNRVWQWHFGRGLVGSPNDFGARGEQPSHPELLDRLAAEFVKSGYHLKDMHRLILKTAVWRQASATSDAADPDNRWLSHFNRRRLSAEELRDSLLAVSGQLDLSPAEGHPFPAEDTWRYTQHDPFNAVYDSNRRSGFLMVQRQRRHPFLSLFDGADPNASTPVRQTTTMPTQALYFINDPFFHRQAEACATKLLTQADDGTRISQAYRTLFQREPTAAEQTRVRQFVTTYPAPAADAWAALVRVFLASNEFLHID